MGGNFEEFCESVKKENLHGFLKISEKFIENKLKARDVKKDYEDLWEGIPKTDEEVKILRDAFARREERTRERNSEQNRPLSRSASAVRHKGRDKDVPELPPEWVKNRIDTKPVANRSSSQPRLSNSLSKSVVGVLQNQRSK